MNLRPVFALLASLSIATAAMAGEAPALVLLPMENISGAPDAPKLVHDAIVPRIARAGWRVIEGDAIEPVLERNRVRYMDSLTTKVREDLAAATGADAFLLITISAFRGGKTAAVTLSGRMIAGDGTLLWANVSGVDLDDTEPLFGGEKKLGPEDVARKAVADFAHDFPSPGAHAKASLSMDGLLRRRPPVSYVSRDILSTSRPRICVLPLDASTEFPEASLVVGNALALRLAAAGHFDVVEPAELRAAAVRARIGSFRALGTDELVRLGKAVGTPLFLRGTIGKYVDSSARGGERVPELDLDLFLVDVERKTVLWSASHARTGSDYVGFLLLGGVTDAATLADRVVREIALAEQKQAKSNTEWAAAHPKKTKPERHELLATNARKDGK